MNIILASQSPRRQEILSFFKIPFTTQVSGFDESLIHFNGDPAKYVMKQSLCKAQTLLPRHEDSLILSADTTVYLKGKIYEKPSSKEQALIFLNELCGNTHFVYTGVSILYKNKIFQDVCETKVTFIEATTLQKNSYLDIVYPLDKAAGYAIQGAGSLMIKKIDGCYYNVMGLPIQTLSHLFAKCGIDLWALAGK